MFPPSSSIDVFPSIFLDPPFDFPLLSCSLDISSRIHSFEPFLNSLFPLLSQDEFPHPYLGSFMNLFLNLSLPLFFPCLLKCISSSMLRSVLQGDEGALPQNPDECTRHVDQSYAYDLFFSFHALAIFLPSSILESELQGDNGALPQNLDECNGHVDQSYPYYHYHSTSTYPYLVSEPFEIHRKFSPAHAGETRSTSVSIAALELSLSALEGFTFDKPVDCIRMLQRASMLLQNRLTL
jgi:hypothetical protein